MTIFFHTMVDNNGKQSSLRRRIDTRTHISYFFKHYKLNFQFKKKICLIQIDLYGKSLKVYSV